ncbi:hypothetical protein K474DRAFT_1667906 [Panus rudis PR-1116 ss-1]|nr:hypothetical protein K474DRAFT_1667906 [Panus rudis PR-1116 ss-1]
MKPSTIVLLALSAVASARPQFVVLRRAADPAVVLKNGQDAIALNDKFKTLTADSTCDAGENACIGDAFAQCVNGKFVTTPCGPGTVCAALPLVNSAGTSVTCTTAQDRDARIAATGATGADSDTGDDGTGTGNNTGNSTSNNTGKGSGNDTGNNAGNSTTTPPDNSDPQKSLTLLDSVIAKGFANDGQDQPADGQVASLTSTNNFINFCATVKLPLTDGKQIKTGSCNPAPMGVIAASSNMPSAKFQFPTNNAEIEPNQSFTVKVAVKHLETGHFTNANENYFSAPQTVNDAGDIRGHSHIVIEKMTSLTQTETTDPNKFVFFKGLNAPGAVLTADVTDGLDEGVYRISTINSAANHQPALVAIAQHGSLDDVVYFTVKKGAKANAAGKN